jgi:site-specific recombinase XerD
VDRLLKASLDEVLAVIAAEKSASTARSYVLAARNFVGILGDMHLEQLTSKLVSDFKLRRMLSVSPASVNVDLRSMKALFSVLVQWEWLTKNPFMNVKLIRIPETETPFLNEEQISMVISSIKNEQLKQIVTFAYYTGCRLNEILHVRWSDIDWANSRISIRNSASFTTKSRKNRMVPMHPELAKILSQMRSQAENDNVFWNKRGGMVLRDTISHQFKRVLRRNKLPETLHFHSLRHSFASVLVEKGTPIYHVSKLLGHSSVKVTERYAHLYAEDGGKYVDQITITSGAGNKTN